MDTATFYKLARSHKGTLTRMIDDLSHAERIKLRDALLADGYPLLPRNLYYDYDKQVWI